MTSVDRAEAPRTARTVPRGTVTAVAIAVMNVATYGFTIIAARLLGPQEYGGLAAVMNVLMVLSVVSLALQATAARRISAAPGDVREVEAGVARLTVRAALVLGALLLAGAPLLDLLLRLDSLPTALLVGATAVPLTLMGGQAGTLQGERRWRALAWLYVAAGVPRLLLGAGLLWWQPAEATAVLAVFVGACCPVLVGWVALRGRMGGALARSDEHRVGALARESVRNSHALLGFFAVSNVDVILARNVLDERDAGLYAGGLILTKAVLFLPQFVVVVAFPDLAHAAARRRALRASLGVVAGLGAIAVLASWLLSGLALVFVGGDAYADVEGRLWLFALLGTALSMVQLLVYALIARESSRASWLLYASLAVILAGTGLVDSVGQLLALVSVVDVALLVGLLVVVALPGTGTTLTRRRLTTGQRGGSEPD